MLEDKLTIWEFNRGNRKVIQQIYEKYKKDLMTLATALLYDISDAEDVVQDVFVSFIKSAERFRLTGSLRSYLASCVANNARNKNKAKQRRQGTGLDRAEQLMSNSVRPDLSAIFGEELDRLAWALSKVPYQQREILLLHLFSGMKFKAVAKLQGESINTVKGRYRYGLDKLRSLLNSKVKK